MTRVKHNKGIDNLQLTHECVFKQLITVKEQCIVLETFKTTYLSESWWYLLHSILKEMSIYDIN